MSNPVHVGDITAIANPRPHGSEILLFKRNDGLLARIVLSEKGNALQQRLLHSMTLILQS